MRGLADRVKQNLTDFAQKLSRNIKKSFDQKFMREVGEESIRLIFTRTKLGYGVPNQGGAKQKLKPLSSLYVQLRKTIQKKGGLDPSTTPKKSNLTKTGQMLRSIKIKRSNDGTVWIGPMGYRKDGLTNEEVANKVSKARPFMYLTNLETKKIQRFAQNNFNSVFKKRFK